MFCAIGNLYWSLFRGRLFCLTAKHLIIVVYILSFYFLLYFEKFIVSLYYHLYTHRHYSIANSPRKRYNLITREEENLVTEIIRKIGNIQLSPQQRETLGLSPDWNKNISPDFVNKVLKAAEEHKSAIKELEKY